MIKVCMFDMGGVVDEFSSEVMEERLLHDFGIYHVNSFVALCPALTDVLHDFMCGLMDEGRFWQMFQTLTGVRLPNEDHLYTKYFLPVKKRDTIQIIAELRENGIRVIAGTNVEPPHRIWHDEHADYDIFNHAYTSDLLHLVKPDKAFFLEIAKQEGLQTEEFFFTDDRLENVEIARSVGMTAYQFSSAMDLRNTLKSLSLL